MTAEANVCAGLSGSHLSGGVGSKYKSERGLFSLSHPQRMEGTGSRSSLRARGQTPDHGGALRGTGWGRKKSNPGSSSLGDPSEAQA